MDEGGDEFLFQLKKELDMAERVFSTEFLKGDEGSSVQFQRVTAKGVVFAGEQLKRIADLLEVQNKAAGIEPDENILG